MIFLSFQKDSTSHKNQHPQEFIHLSLHVHGDHRDFQVSHYKHTGDCEVCNENLSEKDLLKHQTNLGHFKIRPIKDVEKEKELVEQNENISKVGKTFN